MTSLATKADRKLLPFRRGPYWVRIRTGCYLGYRVHQEGGEGTWLARWRDDDGKQHQTAFGSLESYDKALQQAEAWFRHAAQTDGGDVLTVNQVFQHHINELRDEKNEAAARDAEYRFKQLVMNTDLGKMPMDKLRSKHIKDWRNAIAASRSPATVNRNRAVLLAAFNRALRDKLVADNSPWASIKKVKAPDHRRERVLRAEERTRLLDACDADIRPFIEGLILTGCRPGELAVVTVSCFDPHSNTLRFRGGKTGSRSVPISDKMAALCRKQSKGKLPKALLFTRADGKPWHRDNWGKPVKEAVDRAGLGDDVVLYTLRHSSISEMIAGGMNAFVVATLTGTSVAMIQKHYGHLFADQVKLALNAL